MQGFVFHRGKLRVLSPGEMVYRYPVKLHLDRQGIGLGESGLDAANPPGKYEYKEAHAFRAAMRLGRYHLSWATNVSFVDLPEAAVLQNLVCQLDLEMFFLSADPRGPWRPYSGRNAKDLWKLLKVPSVTRYAPVLHAVDKSSAYDQFQSFVDTLQMTSLNSLEAERVAKRNGLDEIPMEVYYGYMVVGENLFIEVKEDGSG